MTIFTSCVLPFLCGLAGMAVWVGTSHVIRSIDRSQFIELAQAVNSDEKASVVEEDSSTDIKAHNNNEPKLMDSVIDHVTQAESSASPSPVTESSLPKSDVTASEVKATIPEDAANEKPSKGKKRKNKKKTKTSTKIEKKAEAAVKAQTEPTMKEQQVTGTAFAVLGESACP